jgi:hypothetical protein
MKISAQASVLILSWMLLCGCDTVYNSHRATQNELSREDSVVFVRPDQYTILGTRSLRDYIEITYEKAIKNEAGFLHVEVGIRNRGGQRFYDTKGPSVHLSIRTAFYTDPISGKGPTSAPVYQTNWQLLTLVRGETEHYETICPVSSGQYYQITLSEELGR